jgi:hypothetical protein
VEFGEEIVFDFNPRFVGRPGVVSPPNVPSKAYFKPILRHTNSDPHAQRHQQQRLQQQQQQNEQVFKSELTIKHANPEQSTDNADHNSDSLVQIFVPQNSENEEREKDKTDEDEEIKIKNVIDNNMRADSSCASDDSDGTLEDQDQPPSLLSPNHTSRRLPPMLADWSRSQSFPPPRTSHENELLGESEAAQRKFSLPEEILSKTSATVSRHECKNSIF